jgi:cation diffusion facilitator CzcD-associated flavoprotein CzcO
VRRAFARLPWLQRAWRAAQYCDSEAIALGFTVRPELMARWQRQAERFLRRTVKDDALAAKLIPSYTMGCKRVLISDDFYPAVARDNVELVTEPIRAVEPTAIITADGRARPVDVIIFATGFKPFDITAGMRVTGRGGRELADDWRGGPEAFYGVAVAGYPNFFLLMGPNSALGHNSIIFMIEAQVRYILQCLRWLDEARAAGFGAPVVEVRAEVQRAFNERLQRRFDRGVWRAAGTGRRGACSSWYVHGSGKNHVLWPGFSASYWWAVRKADRRHYLPLAPAAGDDMLGHVSASSST